MNTEKLEKLFSEYEAAFDKLDLKPIAKNYPDTFISAGPKGSIVQHKKEFEKNVDKAAAFYKSIGQKSGRILHKTITPISNEYCMVTVHWGVTYEKTGDEMIEFDVSYIVQDINNKLSIVFFITHEDEEETMKKLGLQEAIAH